MRIKGGIKTYTEKLVVLKRRTKYKCGSLQREIINYLWRKEKAKIGEIILYALNNYEPRKSERLEKRALVYQIIKAIKRLEKRLIISVK
ncbi:MAG: hypothetical protein QW096_11965 [Thermofilaceae archaeon]